jgi:glycosyltransferase involved in cell wall biosynthesis
MRIINIGVYPPPFGGISIHLKRLKENLDRLNIDNSLFDCSGINSIEKQTNNIAVISFKTVFFKLFFSKKSIIHAHDYDYKRLIALYILSLRHVIIISFHNERFIEYFYSKGALVYSIIDKILNRFNLIIVDNIKSLNLVKSKLHIKREPRLIPEFIPPFIVPDIENEQIIYLKSQSDFLISSNAFQIAFHNGQDLYGIDLLVELIIELKPINIGMVFLLPNIGDQEYFEKLQERIKENQIEDKFIFITKPIEEASSLWKLSDLVIRATNTDGNSLTVLEALSIGTPVLASDCTSRPEGTILFKNRDGKDLREKVRTVLTSIEIYKNALETYQFSGNLSSILKVYDECQKL